MKQKKRLIVVASVFFCYVFTILLYKIINTIIICSKIVLFSSKKLFHRFVALMKTKTGVFFERKLPSCGKSREQRNEHRGYFKDIPEM